jgi:hypothetical protein
VDVKDFSLKMIEIYQSVNGEQETKNKMIEPFFSMLGYDIDCTDDIKTEVICDFGIKKEKVDYELCIAGIPKILVEAKDWRISLNVNNITQLYRYFCTTNCKMAILTNGLDYWFFSDFEKENIMDSRPFYKLNILAPRIGDEKILNAICKVQQCSYDVNQYVIEMKTKRIMRSNKLAEVIAVNYFHNLDAIEAVQNGITAAKKSFSSLNDIALRQ